MSLSAFMAVLRLLAETAIARRRGDLNADNRIRRIYHLEGDRADRR